MMVVGVLTLAVAARGSVELGGLTSAMVGLGVACFGPFIGAAADRYGQRSTLLISGAVNSVALGALAWIAFSELPNVAMLVASFFVGATAPQISPMSRSRLVSIAQSQLPRDLIGSFQISFIGGLFYALLSCCLPGVHVDGDKRLKLFDHDGATGA